MSMQGKGRTQYEVTVIFPYRNKDDDSDQHAVVDELVHHIATITGGVSAWEQNGIEVWDDGNVYIDPARRVATITDDVFKINHVRNIALDAIELLHQRGGVFFQVIGNGRVFVEFLDRNDTYMYDNEYRAYLRESVAA